MGLGSSVGLLPTRGEVRKTPRSRYSYNSTVSHRTSILFFQSNCAHLHSTHSTAFNCFATKSSLRRLSCEVPTAYSDWCSRCHLCICVLDTGFLILLLGTHKSSSRPSVLKQSLWLRLHPAGIADDSSLFIVWTGSLPISYFYVCLRWWR